MLKNLKQMFSFNQIKQKECSPQETQSAVIGESYLPPPRPFICN